ncbi:MAG: hypothetical protein RMN52_02320 [Anaerolineae bacterium]|nr:hypothetical protein [Candidatus Roseilinea sp.]MDW8448816.1 hypothetical protein [Anaerolineae bacterium]
MAILHVRNIPKPLYERVRRIAAQRGQSLSALVIELLEDLDRRESAKRKRAALMRQIRANIEARRREWPADAPAAVDVIRECREERERELMGGR